MQRMLAHECIPLLVASGKNGRTTSGQTRRGLIREKPFTFFSIFHPSTVSQLALLLEQTTVTMVLSSS